MPSGGGHGGRILMHHGDVCGGFFDMSLSWWPVTTTHEVKVVALVVIGCRAVVGGGSSMPVVTWWGEGHSGHFCLAALVVAVPWWCDGVKVMVMVAVGSSLSSFKLMWWPRRSRRTRCGHIGGNKHHDSVYGNLGLACRTSVAATRLVPGWLWKSWLF